MIHWGCFISATTNSLSVGAFLQSCIVIKRSYRRCTISLCRERVPPVLLLAHLRCIARTNSFPTRMEVRTGHCSCHRPTNGGVGRFYVPRCTLVAPRNSQRNLRFAVVWGARTKWPQSLPLKLVELHGLENHC